MTRNRFLVFVVLGALLGLTLSAAAAQDDVPNVPPEKALIASAAAAEVGQTISPPANKTESEDNNSFETADPIYVGDVISGEIGGHGDVDYFQIENWLEYGEFILADIDAQIAGSSLDSVICIYYEYNFKDPVEVSCNDDSDGFDSFLFYNNYREAPSFYVSVRNYSPDEGGSQYYYTLSISTPILLSAAKDGRVDGIPFKKGDILAWQEFTGGAEKWSMFFDASDVSITTNVAAIAVLNQDSLSLVLGTAQSLEVEGKSRNVKPHDILEFRLNPNADGLEHAYGPNTRGEFHWLLQGRDLCLTTNGEKIDALQSTYTTYGLDIRMSTSSRAQLCNGAKFEAADIFDNQGRLRLRGAAEFVPAPDNIIAGHFTPGYDDFLGILTFVYKGIGNTKNIYCVDLNDWTYGTVVGSLNVLWKGRDHGWRYPIDAIAVADPHCPYLATH